MKIQTSRWRFSLRFLLLSLLLVGVGLALLRNWMAAKHREAQAAEWYLHHGGSVAHYNGWEIEQRQWWVRGLSLVLPRDCLYTVRAVYLEKADDDDLRECVHLPRMCEIHLDKSRITDAGLAHVQHLHRLTYLDLGSSPISDAGLARLANNRRLEEAWLEGTRITDRSLPFLARNRGLTHLDLDETSVTDDGVALLAGLPQLEVLALRKTRITNRVTSTLKQLPALKYVYLMETAINDDAVTELAQLPVLQIDIQLTQISPAGEERLRRALPNCRIEVFRR